MNEQNRSSEALDLDALDQLAAAKDLDPLLSSHITSRGYGYMANLTEIIDGGRARFVAMVPKGWADWIAAIDNAAPALIARARRADELERALQDRDAEVERLKSAWQGRENEALTLRAANADFARSFSDLQDELAAGRKDTARMDQVERLREEINNIEGPGGFPEDTWVIWRDEGDVRGEQVGKGRTLRKAIDAVTEVKP